MIKYIYKQSLDKLNFDILIKVSEYLEINDIVNLSLTNKKFNYLFNYILKRIYNKDNVCRLFQDYYDLIIIDNETKNIFNYKSYMFLNSINILKENNYFFISKVYLNEISHCELLPESGYLKFYIGPKIKQKVKFENAFPSMYFNNIYHAKLIYKNNNKEYKYKKIKDIIYKNRKYITIIKKKTLPLSYFRDIYIKNNINEYDEEKVYPYKFSNNYLFGPATYYESNPVDEITTFNYHNELYYNDYILLASFDPKYIFPYDVTNEMISFVIRKSELQKIKNNNIKKILFNNVYVVYNNILK